MVLDFLGSDAIPHEKMMREDIECHGEALCFGGRIRIEEFWETLGTEWAEKASLGMKALAGLVDDLLKDGLVYIT